MHDHLHPTKCFCQIPEEDLRVWAARKFRENKTTVELLSSTDNPTEKEAICAVSLLDVDERRLLEMMGDVDLPEHHILHCREKVKEIISHNNN